MDLVLWGQVEQVSKFTTSRPKRPLADAMVTRKLLTARGWKLICLPEHGWVRLRTFDEKLAFLEQEIEQTVSEPPSLPIPEKAVEAVG